MPGWPVNLPMSPGEAGQVKHKTYLRRIKALRAPRQAGASDGDQLTRAAASLTRRIRAQGLTSSSVLRTHPEPLRPTKR